MVADFMFSHHLSQKKNLKDCLKSVRGNSLLKITEFLNLKAAEYYWEQTCLSIHAEHKTYNRQDKTGIDWCKSPPLDVTQTLGFLSLSLVPSIAVTLDALLENYLLNADGAETLLATVHPTDYISKDSRQCIRPGKRSGHLVKEVHSQLQNT